MHLQVIDPFRQAETKTTVRRHCSRHRYQPLWELEPLRRNGSCNSLVDLSSTAVSLLLYVLGST